MTVLNTHPIFIKEELITVDSKTNINIVKVMDNIVICGAKLGGIEKLQDTIDNHGLSVNTSEMNSVMVRLITENNNQANQLMSMIHGASIIGNPKIAERTMKSGKKQLVLEFKYPEFLLSTNYTTITPEKADELYDYDDDYYDDKRDKNNNFLEKNESNKIKIDFNKQEKSNFNSSFYQEKSSDSLGLSDFDVSNIDL